MLTRNFSILFFLKKPTGYTKGDAPIRLRITVNGERKEIGTTQYCEPERWNNHAQRAKGTNEKTRTLNAFLDALESKVQHARLQLFETGAVVTADSIARLLKGEVETPVMLLEVFAEHNARMAALVNTEFAPGTMERYTTSYQHTKSFMQWKYGKEDIAVKDLSFDFVSDYEFWLKSERKCNHNSAIKYISNMRKIVNICLKSGWILKDPFYGFKMTKREVVREYLTDAELEALVGKSFVIDRLTQVRDIFLFSCYTGLAYSDVFALTPGHISKGVDGNLWIFTRRQKTDTPSRIPLLPQAQEILLKYGHHPKCAQTGKVLPVLTNQKMNSYLKEIADVCGITKTLTYHIARHTFATTITLNNDVPIESVSKMLGHKSIKITQHYAKVMDKKVGADMHMLQERIGLKM